MKYPPGLLIWSASTVFLGLFALLLVVKIFFTGQDVTRQAVDSGQRVVIHIMSGEVDGFIRHTRREEPPATDAGAQAPQPPKAADGNALAPAPLASIIEQSDKGMIPMAGRDGTLAWKYYARPHVPAPGRPMVAIILTNLGLSKPQTEEALKLPHDYTLSFSPYAGDARDWVKKARETGFEALIDLPMEPQNYPMSDPGPYGLLSNLPLTESVARLHWVLARFSGYVGVLGPGDEKLTADMNALRPTLTELAARGLLFLYVKNPQNAAIAELAKTRAALALGVDKLIDESLAPGNVDAQLDALITIAKSQGYAIGVAHSYPPTLDALARFSDSLAAQGVDLVPVSAVAAKVFP